MADRATIIHVVSLLAEAFGRTCTEQSFAAYLVGMEGVTNAQAKTAMATVLQENRKFMPTPGELRELALTEGRGLGHVAAQAWEVFCNAVHRHGYNRSVNFRDGIINATARHLGGWIRVCGLTGDGFDVWLKKEFAATYSQFASKGCSQEALAYLPGETEIHNRQWIGVENPRTKKLFQLPAPETVGSEYPILLPSPEPKQPTEFLTKPNRTNEPSRLTFSSTKPQP